MSGPPPAVAAVRSAVRAALADLEPGQTVLAAVSGGADSLALASALAVEGPAAGLCCAAAVVDHGLQPGSAEHAHGVAAVVAALGMDPVVVEQVVVDGIGGPEAAARRARYAALDSAAERLGAVAVLLGHTRDDQAETVLLGLARGSGARSLAGMAAVSGRYRRPLLSLPRTTTAACCREAGLTPWQDPHNDDRAFRRVRVRHEVMPVLEAELGPGIAESLARTAWLLRDDDAALEAWADRVQRESEVAELPDAGLDAAVLEAAPAAVRRRVLRRVAVAAGVPPAAVSAGHLRALDGLVAEWHGQGPIVLPGGVRGERRCGRLYLARRGPAAEPGPARE